MIDIVCLLIIFIVSGIICFITVHVSVSVFGECVATSNTVIGISSNAHSMALY